MVVVQLCNRQFITIHRGRNKNLSISPRCRCECLSASVDFLQQILSDQIETALGGDFPDMLSVTAKVELGNPIVLLRGNGNIHCTDRFVCSAACRSGYAGYRQSNIGTTSGSHS